MLKHKKILLLAIVLITICFVFTVLSINNLNNKLEVVRKKMVGVEKIHIIHDTNTLLQECRGLHQIAKENRENGTLVSKEIKKTIKFAEINMIKLKEKNIHKTVKDLRQENKETWDDVDYFENYTEAIEKLNVSIVDISHKYGLVFEDDKESYKLITVLVYDIPKFSESVGVIRGLGTRILKNKKIEEKERYSIKNNAFNCINTLKNIRYFVTKIKKNEVLENIIQALETYSLKLNLEVKKIDKGIFERSSIDYFLIATQLSKTSKKLFVQTSELLKERLKERENNLINLIKLSLLFFFVVSAFIIVLFYFIDKKAKIVRIKKENEEKDLRVIANLLEKFYNISTVKDLSEKSLNFLVHELNAANGAFYAFRSKTKQLQLTSIYGVDICDAKQIININENIIGESISDKKIKILNIDDGATVVIGAMSVKIKKIIIIPLINMNEAVGSIQLSFVNNDTIGIKFLEKISELLAGYLFKIQKNEEIVKYLEIIDKNVIASNIDKNRVIIDVSEKFAEISGYTKNELIGKKYDFLKHPDLTKVELEKIWNTVTNNKIFEGQLKNKKKNGDSYWTDSLIYPDIDCYENILGYTSIGQDVTDKKRIEALAITDSLTGLYNRRYFDNMFIHQLKLAKREGQLLFFAMMDIDHFKQYNDIYGHQEGDNALKTVGEVLKKSILRANDYVFRIGGEEFGMICFIKDEASAINIANRVRKNIENLNIEHYKNSASRYVTISVGLSIIEAKTCVFDTNVLYKKTDDLLYDAKQSGRNQVKYKML